MKIFSWMFGIWNAQFVQGYIDAIRVPRQNASVKWESSYKKVFICFLQGVLLIKPPICYECFFLDSFHLKNWKTFKNQLKQKKEEFLEFCPWKPTFLPVKKIKKYGREKKPWAWKIMKIRAWSTTFAREKNPKMAKK